MINIKQLVALVLGHEGTGGGYAPAAMNFVKTAVHDGDSRNDQLRDRRNLAAALSSVLAPKVMPAARRTQPRLVVRHDFGPDTVSAVLLRSLTSQSRVLLCLRQLPLQLRSVHRFILSGVDAILVETDALAHAVLNLGIPACRIVSLCDPGDLALFNQPPRPRNDDACRIIYVGDLEPQAGVADILPCIVAWADRHPARNIEIWWSGDGCLRGVLEAQPLPTNVSQHFPGKVSREELAPMFLESDLLAVPALSDSWADVVSEAVVAQLPVLGSNRSRTVMELITHGVTGWIFDPFEPGAMACAVDLALGALPQGMEHMQACAAARLRQPLPGLHERLRRAMRIEAPELPLDLRSLGYAP